MALSNYTLADKTVTTAGTRVQLTTVKLMVFCVTIQALPGNTGNIFFGDSDVSSTQAFVELSPGSVYGIVGDMNPNQKGNLETMDISTLYIDAEENGDGVHIGYQLIST